MAVIKIVETKSGKVADTIETSHKPDSVPYDKFLDGLYRKVDLDRFHIVEED